MMPINDRPRHPYPIDAWPQPSQRQASIPLLPSSFDLTCADCGATWTVTPADMMVGDEWVTCPSCSNVERTEE